MKRYYVIYGIDEKFEVLHDVKKYIDTLALIGRLTYLDGRHIYRYVFVDGEEVEDESFVRVIRTYIVRRSVRYRIERE